VLAVLHLVECSTVPASAELGRDVLKPEAAPALGLERLLDRHPAVDELQLRRHDRDLDAICGQRAQRHERLQPRDPRTGDQHTWTRAVLS